MKAVTVQPLVAGSVRFEEVPEPDESTGSVLVEAVAVGICGTDVEIASGAYGWAPPGRDRLVLGHESLGRVLDPGPAPGCSPATSSSGSSGARTRCRAATARSASGTCAATGSTPSAASSRSTASCRERWRIEPGFFTKLDPSLGILGVLLEPTTVVTKAWEMVAAMRARAFWEPRTALVTGAGPIGMLAALIGVQHGLDVHVLDRVTEGPKPDLVRDLGATYHSGTVRRRRLRSPTSSSSAPVSARSSSTRSARSAQAASSASPASAAADGRADLPPADLAVSSSCRTTSSLVRSTPTGGTSTARPQALAAADRDWLARLITRRVPPQDIAEALDAPRRTTSRSSSTSRERTDQDREPVRVRRPRRCGSSWARSFAPGRSSAPASPYSRAT